MAIRIVGVDLPQNKRGEVALTYVYAVSYTHLDVYKRQPLVFRNKLFSLKLISIVLPEFSE